MLHFFSGFFISLELERALKISSFFIMICCQGRAQPPAPSHAKGKMIGILPLQSLRVSLYSSGLCVFFPTQPFLQPMHSLLKQWEWQGRGTLHILVNPVPGWWKESEVYNHTCCVYCSSRFPFPPCNLLCPQQLGEVIIVIPNSSLLEGESLLTTPR